MSDTPREHLVDYLTDAYSIEQQALAQLRTAPDVAGEPRLAALFRDHLLETERQAEMVRERLEALGGSPKKVKDAVMALGGKGFLLFARVQPDTPGKLAAHAYSFEAMEWGSYEMLIRMAERAGDEATAAMARAVRDQERAMMERLEGLFDAVADRSIEGKSGEDLESALRTYLADAHAIEQQAIQMLEKGSDVAGDPVLARIYRDHLAESRLQAQWIDERLEELGGDHSTIKDTALRAMALNWGMFFQAQKDTPGKLAVFTYAFEHLEIAAYRLLRRVAERAGDTRTVQLAERILGQEQGMAERLSSAFDRAFEASPSAQSAPAAEPVGAAR